MHSRRPVCGFCLWVFIVSSLKGLLIEGATLPKNPNVLFIVVDDLRTALGCYGHDYILTPNIDQLAARSVKFTQAHAQQALCGPSRTSFLTSRRPDTTRLYDVHSYWRKAVGNYTTLPQHFKENGYHTRSVGKIFHPGMASGHTYDYPYSWSEIPYIPSTLKYRKKKVCPGPDGKKYMSVVCPVDVSTQPEGTLPDIQNAEHAIKFLQERSAPEAEKPFFLGLGLYKPHLPWKFPKEFLDLYPLSDIDLAPDPHLPPGLPKVAWNPWTDFRERDDIIRLNVSFPWGPVPKEYQLKMRQNYYASTTYMDYYLGKVLSALDKYGFSNNTIITFIGDHGFSLGEHQEWSKFSLFEVATRVPMLVYVPGVTYSPTERQIFPHIDPFSQKVPTQEDASLKFQGGHTSNAMVESLDLFPTLAELSGLPIPPLCPPNPFKIDFCTEGMSLAPLLRSAMKTNKELHFPMEKDKMSVVGAFDKGMASFKQISQDMKNVQWKNASFSQYPRPSDTPVFASDQPRRLKIKVMGYSMTTSNYRYTEWVGFDPRSFTTHWNDVHASELYLHQIDPLEDKNVAGDPQYKELVKELSHSLRRGWRGALPISPET